jgi:peptidoglycan/xylan/chitin deacetylase (PgdA/CDA1 family)
MRELVEAPWGPRLVGLRDGLRLLAGGKLRAPGAIVLAYHDIGDDPANSTDYYVSTARFRQQLRHAMEWGLRFVDLAELVSAVISGHDIDGLGSIVFDDSLVGVHHDALPVLVELGLPATIFTVSDALGSTPPWWDGAARVMTRREVEEAASAGLRIASHTRTHPSLPSLAQSAIQDELAGCKRQLEEIVGRQIDLFAYPYGHYDRRVREEVACAGYRAGFSFLNGRVTAGLDRFRLPRLNMWQGQGVLRLAYHLARPPSSWPTTQLGTVADAAKDPTGT